MFLSSMAPLFLTKEKIMFNNVARLSKEQRENHPQKFTQADISILLGYKNGQIVSNWERAKCCIPIKAMKHFCEITQTPVELMRQAYIDDQLAKFNKAFE